LALRAGSGGLLNWLSGAKASTAATQIGISAEARMGSGEALARYSVPGGCAANYARFAAVGTSAAPARSGDNLEPGSGCS
jgi:hypothetical protein